MKENVVIERKRHKKNIVAGVPACDLNALDLLDEIYLKSGYIDPAYEMNRNNTVLIGTDCLEIQENCHCTAYGSMPYPERNHDLSLVAMNDDIILSVHSNKGSELINEMQKKYSVNAAGQELVDLLHTRREDVLRKLRMNTKALPDTEESGRLISDSDYEIWERYASSCVSCGACATACPTCTCFLLIDRPDFEKIRQIDACQFPGFERTAGGSDPLKKKPVRFKNRYLCKYVWKPQNYKLPACTGCGRCIDNCIGNISKNELLIELSKKAVEQHA